MDLIHFITKIALNILLFVRKAIDIILWTIGHDLHEHNTGKLWEHLNSSTRIILTLIKLLASIKPNSSISLVRTAIIL